MSVRAKVQLTRYATGAIQHARYTEERISELLRRVTGIGLRTDIVPSQAVEVIGLTNTGEVNMVMEGFGSNALILLLLQLVTVINGATVMIEEPEIHLHPKAQAELASVLAAEAKAGDKQIIMTTHSEHILGRLLTLVAIHPRPRKGRGCIASRGAVPTGEPDCY